MFILLNSIQYYIGFTPICNKKFSFFKIFCLKFIYRSLTVAALQKFFENFSNHNISIASP